MAEEKFRVSADDAAGLSAFAEVKYPSGEKSRFVGGLAERTSPDMP
jgi:hypothetical protein